MLDREKRVKSSRIFPLLLVALLVIVPTMMENNILFSQNKYVYLLLCLICIYSIVTSGLDLLYGYAGQISMGHAAFFAIGAYTTVLLCHPDYGIGAWLGFTLPPALTIFLGAAVTTVAGVLLSIPASKLVFHFLSLLTIAFDFAVYLAAVSFSKVTNGVLGITRVPAIEIFGFSFTTVINKYRFLMLCVFFTVLLVVLKDRLVHSRFGRSLTAIRENPVAAGGCGINTARTKTVVFGISAFYAGFAGALYAHCISFVSPDIFTHDTSVIIFTMLLFGGSGSLYGPILGAAVITLIQEGLQGLDNYRMLIYGIFLLVVVLIQPRGLNGIFENLIARVKRTYQKAVGRC